MFFLLNLLIGNVYASTQIDYRWYKYNNSSYMSIEDSNKIDCDVDYSDYIYKYAKDDKFYEINDLIGQYIYVYSKNDKFLKFKDISVYYKDELVNSYVGLAWKATVRPVTMNGGGRFIIYLTHKYNVDDISFKLEYGTGDLWVGFSPYTSFTNDIIGEVNISRSGTYKFDTIRDIKYNYEKLYKTYYNRVNGNYSQFTYSDYIYKDVNDFKYFSYDGTINNYETKLEDLIDTNYSLIEMVGEVNYFVNGEYLIKYIFDGFEKEIIVKVNIIDNVIKKYDEVIRNKDEKIVIINEKNLELENSIKVKNTKIEELNNDIVIKNNLINSLNVEMERLNERINVLNSNKSNYLKLVNLKNKCFEELDRVVKKFNLKSREYYYLNDKYEKETDYYKRYIGKLKLIKDENYVDKCNVKKSSSFVTFKNLFKFYDRV